MKNIIKGTLVVLSFAVLSAGILSQVAVAEQTENFVSNDTTQVKPASLEEQSTSPLDRKAVKIVLPTDTTQNGNSGCTCPLCVKA